jgi:hypothetical protein
MIFAGERSPDHAERKSLGLALEIANDLRARLRPGQTAALGQQTHGLSAPLISMRTESARPRPRLPGVSFMSKHGNATLCALKCKRKLQIDEQ